MVLSKPPICIDLFSHYSYFSNQNVKCHQIHIEDVFLFLFSSYYNSGTLYHVTWHICEPSKWSGIKNPQSQIKVTIQISVHYHVIALGVSLEAMQIDTDVTFCSKISGSQQKVKKGKKVHIAISDMIACKPIGCFKNHWVLRLWAFDTRVANGLTISKPPMILNVCKCNMRLNISLFLGYIKTMPEYEIPCN